MLAKQTQKRNLLMQKIFYIIRNGSSFRIQISIQNSITEHSSFLFSFLYSNLKQKIEKDLYQSERLRPDYFKNFIYLFYFWRVHLSETLTFIVLLLLLYFQPCRFRMQRTGFIFIQAMPHISSSLFVSLSIFA